jgi:EpsI family protein
MSQVDSTRSTAARVSNRPETSAAVFPGWRSLVVVVITALTVAGVAATGHINRASEAGVNLTLPDSISGYLGFDEDVSPAERRILPADTEFAKKRYVGAFPSEINCEIVLSGAQKSSIHRPQVCLTGQGWTIVQEQPLQLPLPGGATQRVRLLTLSRQENGRPVTGYFLYWFVGRNRTTDEHVKRILYTSWDRVVHGVNHRWAYVIVSAIIPGALPPWSPATRQTLQQLTQVTQQLIPAIQKPEVNRQD